MTAGVTLTPAAKRKLRKLARLAGNLHKEQSAVAADYRAVLDERTKVTSNLPKLEREAERAAVEAGRVRGNRDQAAVERWRDHARRELDEQRERLAVIEADVAELGARQSQLQARHGCVSRFVDRLVDALGFRKGDFERELRGQQ